MYTERDLTGLRAATRRVLEREPDAALVAAAAAPIKRRIPRPGHEERAMVRLPVQIEGSATPGGVPLHAIAKALRAEVPGVTGVSATPAGLSVKFAKRPTAAQRRKLEALLKDRERLERLKPGADDDQSSADGDAALVQALRDPQTSDAAWLRAFRRYAVAHLIEREP
jgi:hypothetical protein